MTEIEVQAIKDEDSERPIPSAWRPVFSDIVTAFTTQDYLLSSNLSGVAPVSNETAHQIKEYIQDYGEELVKLPEESWESSMCIWMGNRWNVLIDLWTTSEGRSDLVLSAWVSENDGQYIVNIDMVYVP